MLTINEQRLLSDLNELSEIGKTSAGGVNRPALSELDVETRNWFKAKATDAGLTIDQDGAGNLTATLPSNNPDAKILLAGSHLDSVPNGGRFDGPVGVLSALESLRTIKESGLDLPVHLRCISFTDEEGSWLSLIGSRAFIGEIMEQDLNQVRGGVTAFDEALARIDCTRASVLQAKCNPDDYVGFVEVHIEQGTRLEKQKLNIGVVDEIVGIQWYWLKFLGEAAHSGTMPMADRKDANWGASLFVQRAKEIVKNDFFPGVMNCGQAQFKPGAFNIVPAEVELALELRHGSKVKLNEMEQIILEVAKTSAAEFGLNVNIEPVTKVPPAPMSEHVIANIEKASSDLGLSHIRLMSFAGHDTQSLSAIMPASMFFVPSVNGISHNPKEFTHKEDVVNAGNVMLNSLLNLAQ